MCWAGRPSGPGGIAGKLVPLAHSGELIRARVCRWRPGGCLPLRCTPRTGFWTTSLENKTVHQAELLLLLMVVVVMLTLPHVDLRGPASPGSQGPFPSWISLVLPGSQGSCPSWISVVLPCLDLSGPALPGSQWSCPSWISGVLPCLDLSGSAPPGSQGSCHSWISVTLPYSDLSGPASPGCQTTGLQSWGR